ncbi:MAG: nucleoside hydrolase [Anaerolineae bacterium]
MIPRNVIIDCDTGVDDALALLLALRSPAFNVLGITCVAGNVSLHKVVRNTLTVVEHSGKRVPVYVGAATSLVGWGKTAEHVHGDDGLGNLGLPHPTGHAETESAVAFLIRTFMDAKEPVELVTLAPLTNIALALVQEPRLARRIPSLVIMGGDITGGNVTAAAEFNIYIDPEAADVVMRSGIPTTLVPYDVIKAYGTISADEIAAIENASMPCCQLGGRLMRFLLERDTDHLGVSDKIGPADPAAMAVAIEPGIATVGTYHVAIETRGEHTRGATVVDRRSWIRPGSGAQAPNASVVTAMDTSAYRALVRDTYLRAE